MGYATKARATTAPVEYAPAPVRKTTDTLVWSAQQVRVFDWFEQPDGSPNLLLRARAGCAKTTTIIEGVNRAPETSILVAAFNKRIADELTNRLTNPNASAKTLHGVGYQLIREYWGSVRVAKGDERANALTDEVCGKSTPFGIKKLVSKLHTKGREIAPAAKCAGDLVGLAEKFECEPQDFWQYQGFDLRYVCDYAFRAMVLAASGDKPRMGIDFADMIYLPLALKMVAPRYDLGVVDEAQDMTVSQLELFRQIIKPGGRICVVGDDRQAIYGFRGADTGSLDRLKKELNASEMGLTTTYRCGRAIVDHAKALVPDFEAGADNGEGEIRTIDADTLVDEAQPGDFILSRLNAPLAGYAMQLLRSGKRAQIAGRDIGNGLKALVRKLSKVTKDVDAFLIAVDIWRSKETARLRILKFETRAALVEDQAETLYHLAEGAQTVGDIERTIDSLFSDDGPDTRYVLLSSVHKAKGLEADKVFALSWTFRKGKDQEENNIYYVCVTRARSVLTFVVQ